MSELGDMCGDVNCKITHCNTPMALIASLCEHHLIGLLKGAMSVGEQSHFPVRSESLSRGRKERYFGDCCSSYESRVGGHGIESPCLRNMEGEKVKNPALVAQSGHCRRARQPRNLDFRF